MDEGGASCLSGTNGVHVHLRAVHFSLEENWKHFLHSRSSLENEAMSLGGDKNIPATFLGSVPEGDF